MKYTLNQYLEKEINEQCSDFTKQEKKFIFESLIKIELKYLCYMIDKQGYLTFKGKTMAYLSVFKIANDKNIQASISKNNPS